MVQEKFELILKQSCTLKELSDLKKFLFAENIRICQERNELDVIEADLILERERGPVALKKRYKELLKIFHPDNVGGDTEIIQMINLEYQKLTEAYNYGKKA